MRRSRDGHGARERSCRAGLEVCSARIGCAQALAGAVLFDVDDPDDPDDVEDVEDVDPESDFFAAVSLPAAEPPSLPAPSLLPLSLPDESDEPGDSPLSPLFARLSVR